MRVQKDFFIIMVVIGNFACVNLAKGYKNLSKYIDQNSFTIGGTVSGLLGGGLVLQNNGGDDLSIAANGSFTFSTELTDSDSYSITVASAPTGPVQVCSIANGKSTVNGANVTDVIVTCSTSTYKVGGTVSGLSGGGLVLQNNGGDDLAISTDGTFTFSTALADLSPYTVTVLTHPSSPSQFCSVVTYSVALSGADITDVEINCTTNTYTIGGSVSGLSGGGLVLQNNGGDDLAISADGTFTFPVSLVDLSTYTVTVATQPSGPSQQCDVTASSPGLNGANVTDVQVNCNTNSFFISGTVSGVSGTGMVIQNNGGDDIAVSSDGNFTFSAPLLDLSSYSVTVSTQPSGQTCTVWNGNGALAGADITNVIIGCYVEPETQIAGLVFWFSADSLGQTNGSNVNLWTAIDANAYTAEPVGVANYPVYYENKVNGFPALYFNGNTHLSLESDNVGIAGSGITIFIVGAPTITSGNTHLVFDYGGYGGPGYSLAFQNGVSNVYRAESDILYFDVGKSAGTYSLLVVDMTYGTGKNVYLDGSLIASNSVALSGAYSNGVLTWGTSPGPPVIGGQSKSASAGYSRRYVGYLAEILFYSEALSTADREKVECMLKTKYNLTSVSNTTCP